MTTRIEDIFLLARDTLNDHNKERWSDETLLRNLKLAVQDIAIETNLFKHIITIPLKNGHGTYEMPDGILTLSHVTYDREDLPLRSSGWMSANREIDWRTTSVELPIGELAYAVFDEVKRKEIAVYPKPFGTFTYPYVSEPNEYGLIGGIEDYSQPSAYGATAELIDSDMADDVQTSYYGVVTSVTEEEVLTIYYSRCPAIPISIDDDLELDECFDHAIKFYICGIALRNDIDVANRNMATEEFKLYSRTLESIMELASTDSVAAPWFESHYDGMG